MGWGPQIWAALFPEKKDQASQGEVAVLELWIPPPLPEVPPDPTDPADEPPPDLSTIAPPSLMDVPGDVKVDSFVEAMTPPPPPDMGKPDPNMKTIPTGNFHSGRVTSNLGQIFDLKDLDQQPSARGMHGAPVYPSEMKRNGITGQVIVLFVVDANGDVRDVTIVSSTHREFETPAIQAVQKWKYRAGRRAGKAVNVRMQIPFQFNMSEDEI
jgi:protein TonB